MKDPLTLTNPVDRMNDLLNLQAQQIVIAPSEWASAARSLMVYYAMHYEPRKADEFGRH